MIRCGRTPMPAPVIAITLAVSQAGTAFAVATQPVNLSPSPMTELPAYGTALIKMFGVVLAIVAALLIAARILPRWLGRSLPAARAGLIEVVAVRSLEAGKRLYLIRVAGQIYLVGVSGDRMTLLSDGGPIAASAVESVLKSEVGASRIGPLAHTPGGGTFEEAFASRERESAGTP